MGTGRSTLGSSSSSSSSSSSQSSGSSAFDTLDRSKFGSLDAKAVVDTTRSFLYEPHLIPIVQGYAGMHVPPSISRLVKDVWHSEQWLLWSLLYPDMSNVHFRPASFDQLFGETTDYPLTNRVPILLTDRILQIKRDPLATPDAKLQHLLEFERKLHAWLSQERIEPDWVIFTCGGNILYTPYDFAQHFVRLAELGAYPSLLSEDDAPLWSDRARQAWNAFVATLKSRMKSSSKTEVTLAVQRCIYDVLQRLENEWYIVVMKPLCAEITRMQNTWNATHDVPQQHPNLQPEYVSCFQLDVPATLSLVTAVIVRQIRNGEPYVIPWITNPTVKRRFETLLQAMDLKTATKAQLANLVQVPHGFGINFDFHPTGRICQQLIEVLQNAGIPIPQRSSTSSKTKRSAFEDRHADSDSKNSKDSKDDATDAKDMDELAVAPSKRRRVYTDTASGFSWSAGQPPVATSIPLGSGRPALSSRGREFMMRTSFSPSSSFGSSALPPLSNPYASSSSSSSSSSSALPPLPNPYASSSSSSSSSSSAPPPLSNPYASSSSSATPFSFASSSFPPPPPPFPPSDD